MEFQVQGSVLIDGEWVSRPADVYQIMQRNQQQEDVDMNDSATVPLSAVPEVGILTNTVVQSPLYSTVIPANIRHRELDDVVFVGEDFVQVKEICDYGHLRHIATKSDFKGKILAAKAFGDPRKVQINTSEKSPLLKRTSVHRPRRSTTSEEELTLPLEVIVLTLSTRTVMFLWARESQAGLTSFIQRTVQLPAGSSRFHRPGQHLAIDPKCRAIAVAAQEGCFMLYKTKTMDEWRVDMRAGRDEVPIVEEKQFPIDGRIMHMEFLSTGINDDDSQVVLVFIMVQDGKTKIATYDWDFTKNLEAEATITKSVLDFDNRNPSLFIPLSRSTDFLLVHDEHICLCKGVLSGPPVTAKTSIPERYLKPLRPGCYKSRPHWVQWDRAPRNPDFSKEAFYLAREDGAIIYVERMDGANSVEIADAGSWPYPIDTAFACLKADCSEFAQSYPDVLVAGGFGSDGHLCKVGAWPKEYASNMPSSQTNEFGFIESLPNWAPLTDMSLAQLGNIPLPYDGNRASLFVSNGTGPHGKVSQLRRGLRALVEYSFGGLKGSTALWIVDHGSTTFDEDGELKRQDYATFIVNAPPETLVMRTSRTQEEGSYSQGSFGSAWDSGMWETVEPTEDGFIRHAETISASPYSKEFAVQITYNEARVLRRPELNQVDSIEFPNALLGAATKPGLPFIVVASRQGTSPVLQSVRISDDGTFRPFDKVASPCALTSDPTCIEILSTKDGPLIFVGAASAGFLLFKVNQNGALVLFYDACTLARQSGMLQRVYESVVLLTTRGCEKLVCGTRDGLLVCFDVPKTDQDSLHDISISRMGSSTVTVTPNNIDRSMAFAACGPDFCRVRLPARGNGMQIDSVWLEDPNYPTRMQEAANAMDQVPLTITSIDGNRNLGGFIFAVFGDQMVFARLDHDIRWSGQTALPLSPEEGKIVPRNLATFSTPTRLMVTEDLPHHMIVVTNELKEEKPPPRGYRTMLSSLKVLDLLEDESTADSEVKEESAPTTPKSRLEKTEIPLKHYEQVYSMIRWVFVDEKGRQHALIVVGTGIRELPMKETGRRLILNISKSGLNLQDKKKFDKPVRCIAAYDDQHIVSIIGNVLQIEQIERTEAARWKPRGQIQLPSAGVQMTVSGNFIYVSTSHDSHLCFQATKLPESDSETTFKIAQVFSDSRQRPSLRHLVYRVESPSLPTPATTIVLLTDKNASVTGLFHPPHPSNKSATTTLFEACLPRSVIRIQRGDIRPPWRRAFSPDSGSNIARPTGILDDAIIGACTDGTIYSFTTLSAPALRLLRLLQNLIEAKHRRDPELKFSTVKHSAAPLKDVLQNGAEGDQDSAVKARDVDPEVLGRGPGAPRWRWVDGDLVGRFFEAGGELGQLIGDGCAEDIWRVFGEAARGVLGAEVGTKEGELLEGVRTWVGEVLMPLL